MIVGGLGDGCGELQAGLRQLSGISRLLRGLLRTQAGREHSRNYLQGLLVQAQERRNAENLSESVGVSARAMQRFLTEARWDDDRVIARLQEYLAPRLGYPLRCGCSTAAISPSRASSPWGWPGSTARHWER